LGAPLFAARVIATGAPHGFGTWALALQLSERTLGRPIMRPLTAWFP